MRINNKNKIDNNPTALKYEDISKEIKKSKKIQDYIVINDYENK